MSKWTEESFLHQERWFHGTRKVYAVDILSNGAKANKNKNKPSDFGKGLYLCPNFEWCQNYTKSIITTTDEDFVIDDDEGVIIEFYFNPILYLGKYRYKYFPSMTQEYAKFVYMNWKYPDVPYYKRNYHFMFGPMSDGKQLILMEKLRNHEITKEEVIKEFMLPKEDWQLLLRSQHLCDELKVVQTYNLKGEKINVI